MNEHAFCQHLLSKAWADFRVTHPELKLRQFTHTIFELAPGHKCYTIEGPDGFNWEIESCCAWSAKTDALTAYEAHLERLPDPAHRCTFCHTAWVDSDAGYDTCEDCLRRA